MPVVKSQPSVQANPKAYNVRPSNSSNCPNEPADKGIKFDKDAAFYDMSGEKFLIIVNHYKFRRTKHYWLKPSTRKGTFSDANRLKQVFYELGFKIFVLRDLKYKKIINYLTAIAALDHTRTSCICVAILTHGDKGGKICAADKPYLLSDLIAIFETQNSLANKPKLFFVQACRGGYMDVGHTVYLNSQSDSAVTVPTYSSPQRPPYNFSTEETVFMMMQNPPEADSRFLRFCCFPNLFTASGSNDRSDWQNGGVLTVPTHANTLVLRSTVEDYVSYRDKDGSWMIQALCDAIQDNHKDLNLLDIIIKMNRTVAYDRITTNCEWKPMNDKKQMPETKFTLTKQLKF